MAWLSNWDQRVKLTTDNGDITAALSDFPILLYISASSGRNSDDISFVFDELTADANRKKIAVTTTDGTTECYVEIEKWDDGNEKAWLWVKAPSIADDADADFYLYYDVDHADNDTYVGDATVADRGGARESVWDSNFKFVSHMIDEDTSTVIDSTSNDNDGTKKGAGEPDGTASDLITDAQHFDASDDYIGLTDDSFESDSAGTIEAWIKRDTASKDFDIIFSASELTGGNLFELIVSEDTGYNLYVHHYKDGAEHNDLIYGDTTLGTGEHHVVLTSSGTAWALYVDGAAEGLGTIVGSNTGDWFADLSAGTHKVRIGQRTYDTTTHHYYDGIIDEVRVSNTERNAAWVKASYETGRDDLLDWGSEETAVAFIPKVTGII